MTNFLAQITVALVHLIAVPGSYSNAINLPASLDDQKPAKLSETDNGNKAESGSQTEEYQGLLKENEAIDKAYRMGLDKAKTVEDRKEAREKLLTEPRIKRGIVNSCG